MLLRSSSPPSTSIESHQQTNEKSSVIRQTSDWNGGMPITHEEEEAAWSSMDISATKNENPLHTSSSSSPSRGKNEEESKQQPQQLIKECCYDDDDDDESDVPELIAEDAILEATSTSTTTTRLNLLQSPNTTRSPPLRIPTPSSAPPPPSLNLDPITPIQTPSSLRSSLKKSTSPSPIAANAANTTTTTLTKSTTTKSPKKTTPTSRRVRGLWDDDNVIVIPPDTTTTTTTTDHQNLHQIKTTKKNSNIFSQLRDETILHCLSYLEGEPLDLLAVQQVGRRFHSLVTTCPSLWKTIDATRFVHSHFNKNNQSSVQTTKALGNLLLQHPPETLIIREIGNKLQADESFLPSSTGRRLKNLTLTHFEDLTDTHVHVMLLLLALPPSKKKNNYPILKNKAPHSGPSNCSLYQLALEDCPKLTNATVRSIASSPSCVDLVSLSLQGDSGISDLLPLAKLFAIQNKPTTRLTMLRSTNPTPPTTTKATTSNALSNLFGPPLPPKPAPALGSLFAPPKPAAPSAGLHSLFAAPTTTTKLTKLRLESPPASPPGDRTIALHSLFAPPGTSPPHTTTTTTANALPTIPFENTKPRKNKSGGVLSKINIRSTQITPQAWLECCQEACASSSSKLSLHSFSMDGSHWTHLLLENFCDLLSLRDLRSLHLEGARFHPGLLEGATRLRSLRLGAISTKTNGTNHSNETRSASLHKHTQAE